MDAATIDPAMGKIQQIWAEKKAAGWTLRQLGEAMGYPPEQARQAASQFLGGSDCRVSSLRRFAKAVGRSPASLVRD